jgi:hypothetical protein
MEETLKGFLPLYDTIERLVYIKAEIEDDKQLKRALKNSKNVEEIREELENL